MTMSTKDQDVEKRKSNKEQNSSHFRATTGYVHVNEQRIYYTGIRGGKQYLVFGIVILLLLVALANLLLTLGILFMLRIDHTGMRDLELVSGGQLTRFLGDLEVEEVHLVQNKIQSPDGGLEIGSHEGYPVVLKINNGDSTGATVTADPNGISISNINEFVIIDSESGEFVFTTDFEQFKLPEELEDFQTKKLKTEHVTSYGRDLAIETPVTDPGSNSDGGDIEVSAEENVSLNGRRDIGISAEGDINFSSGEGSLNLVSAKGLVLKSFQDLLAFPDSQGSASVPVETSKLCICQNTGVVFRLPPHLNCNQISMDDNPCML